MKATVMNLREEIQEALIAEGYRPDDRLDINFIEEVADRLGIPQVDVPGIEYDAPRSRPQHREDGTFEEI